MLMRKKKVLNVSSVIPKNSQQQVTLGLQRSLKRDTAYLNPVRPVFKLVKGILQENLQMAATLCVFCLFFLFCFCQVKQ